MQIADSLWSFVSLAFTNLLLAEEAFYKQMARVKLIKLGDQNTSYFQKEVAIHGARNKPLSINDSQGVRHDYSEVKDIVVSYFKGMLGTASSKSSRG